MRNTKMAIDDGNPNADVNRVAQKIGQVIIRAIDHAPKVVEQLAATMKIPGRTMTAGA